MQALKRIASMLTLSAVMSSASATTVVTTLAFPYFSDTPGTYIEGGYVVAGVDGTSLRITNTWGCSPACADDGGTYVVSDPYQGSKGLAIKAADGRAFRLASFMGAEFPFHFPLTEAWAANIQVVGVLLDGSLIEHRFNLDQINDGAGGMADFERFEWPATFALREVRFVGGARPGAEYAGFAIDNVVLVSEIPEPPVAAMLGLGLAGLAGWRRKGHSKASPAASVSVSGSA